MEQLYRKKSMILMHFRKIQMEWIKFNNKYLKNELKKCISFIENFRNDDYRFMSDSIKINNNNKNWIAIILHIERQCLWYSCNNSSNNSIHRIFKSPNN